MTKLPRNWILTQLGNACEILDFKRVPVNSKERKARINGKPDNQLFPYYGATGQVDVIDGYLFEGEHVLLGEDGAPFLDPFRDKAYVVDGKFWVNNHAHILRAYGSNKYLSHYLNSIRYEDHVSGTTRLKLTKGALTSIPLMLPPPGEQQRIVEKVEVLFEEIDRGVESLRAAKNGIALYRQSLLKSAFEGRLTADWRAQNPDKLECPDALLARAEHERSEWQRVAFTKWTEQVEAWQSAGAKGPKPRRPEASMPAPALTLEERAVLPIIPEGWVFLRLRDIAEVGSGMSVSKARTPEVPVNVPYLRVSNVQRGFLDLGEIKTMQIEMSQTASLRLRQWDVLFNEGGDRDKLGRGWVWESQIPHCITQNHVFRASPFRRDLAWSKYISQWGNSFGRDYFEKGGKQTTNLASINKTVLKGLPVPYCSPAEQTKIVEILDTRLEAAEMLDMEIDASLARADALRQSILKKAFSGQLVPQNPDDEPASGLLERIQVGRARTPARSRRVRVEA